MMTRTAAVLIALLACMAISNEEKIFEPGLNEVPSESLVDDMMKDEIVEMKSVEGIVPETEELLPTKVMLEHHVESPAEAGAYPVALVQGGMDLESRLLAGIEDIIDVDKMILEQKKRQNAM